jgi:hydrogenase nickel incorporation protein HypA/HybF
VHELAIAQRLIETAVALLPPEAQRITALKVQLGALAGLSEDELRFGFEAMSPQTPCMGANLEIHIVPAIAHCPMCGVDFTVAGSDGLICPSCNAPGVIVVQGKELLITSLEASDEAAYA